MNTTNTTVNNQDVQRAAEQALRAKYPKCNIVPGSLAFHTEGYYAGKNVVVLIDVHNGEEVLRATSDLHTWTGYGPNTIKIYRKAQKLLKKLGVASIDTANTENVDINQVQSVDIDAADKAELEMTEAAVIG